MKYEVYIPKAYLHHSIRLLVIVLSFLGLLLLGRAVSPTNSNGMPMFLSPHLAEITSYALKVQQWTEKLQETQDNLTMLLAHPSSDLLIQDNQIDLFYGQLINLKAEVESTRVPSTLEGLQSVCEESLTASLDASLQIAGWISTPTADNYNAANNALNLAQNTLAELKQNPWVQAQP